MKLRKIFAFTLAEVLITLSILGVVAAITVPSLIKRQHRNEVETKLKKFNSTMINALETSMAENGPITSWTYDSSLTTHAAYSGEIMHKYITPYLNLTEDYGGLTGVGTRWKVTGPKDSNQIGYSYSTYCFKDGMCFHVWFIGVSSGHVNVASDGGFMGFGVDINGKKGPNILGEDVFVLAIVNQAQTSGVENFQMYGIRHNESAYSNYVSRCKSGDTQMCAEWIAKNNWKIPSDYPWL